MLPTIGRIVHYTLSEQDAEAINRRREDFAEAPATNTGFVGHVGNPASTGDIYPAMVVNTFGGTAANLQVFLDGNDTYWATSRVEGADQGTWA
ncbi:hypothetical protein [Phytohabitans aurantiacus]|uniref:Uncharacterized protein n=1 Tax=Phytohabitans aurantiacus TaxID=3016789 RepID=A0ABQ5QSH7_9ACTN|nr:hypothetical protein [Phytohabitans aurantiacus]GLH97359.1 hypothetical protein Pa4123_26340 [Phytohabitans aurantiacus]